VFSTLRRLVKTVTTVLFVAVIAYAGWRWGDRVFPGVERWAGLERARTTEGNDVSPAVGQVAMSRLSRLEDTGGPGQVSFSSDEVTSVLRFEIADRVPSGVLDPEVRLADDRVRASGRLVLASFSGLADLDDMIGVLPDTVGMVTRGSLIPFGASGSAFVVDRIELGRVPLPRRLVPSVLSVLRPDQPPGLPEHAIYVPLPSGYGSAYVEDDRLIITASGGD
jgi:hypothetical protein